MLVGLASCFFMDNISTGLDSSTTFEIIKFLQQMAHLMDRAVVISLLQPPPETFELFDDIILLCEGQIVYQGPRENAIDFFASMGFKCPKRKNVADFLQEVLNQINASIHIFFKGKVNYQFVPIYLNLNKTVTTGIGTIVFPIIEVLVEFRILLS
jgi:ABC-type multidrug transport system ATPase subunit